MCNSLFYIIKADDRSEQIEHVVQIDSLPDMELVFRFGHIVEQKLQDQGAAKAAALDLELRKAHGQVAVPDVLHADEAGLAIALEKR